MTKSLYVIDNSTLINGQFSFTIFDTYYPDKQSALKRAKSKAKAIPANYQKKTRKRAFFYSRHAAIHTQLS